MRHLASLGVGLGLVWLWLLPAAGNADVACGGHRAATCRECPQGNGHSWCNGDCKWWDGECYNNENEIKGTVRDFPLPPDVRADACREVTTPVAELADLKVSVVIPWLNESWEHMEGTLRAMLYFTPDELIEEYIFISDGNVYAREAELTAISSKVRVLALPEREGLIRAKMKGVEIAKAPVIVFMEAHCIVNRGWLEPLLLRVKENPRVLAMPLLDFIPVHDWHGYHRGIPGHWRYEWNFNLIFTNPGKTIKDSAEPYPTPGTSGGIFAMRRDWFDQLGLFDPGMREWGGDHMELTMKVWRCGGKIEIVPCSRVGHLYRDPQYRPYEVEVNTVVHNYKRLAELWAKDHLDLFYKMKPEAVNMKLVGMDTVRANYEKLQKELGCKDLQWYLDNIDHEMKWEMDKLCHPHKRKGDPLFCKGKLVPGRFTVTKMMPTHEYLAAKAAADERMAAEAAKAATDSGSLKGDEL